MFHFEVPVEVDLVEGFMPAGVAHDLVVLLLKVPVQGLLAVALKWVNGFENHGIKIMK